jgi:hypothetical protein
MYAIYGKIYNKYTPNVTIYGINGSYGFWSLEGEEKTVLRCSEREFLIQFPAPKTAWQRSFQGGHDCATDIN